MKVVYSSGNVYDQYISSSCAHKSCTGDSFIHSFIHFQFQMKGINHYSESSVTAYNKWYVSTDRQPITSRLTWQGHWRYTINPIHCLDSNSDICLACWTVNQKSLFECYANEFMGPFFAILLQIIFLIPSDRGQMLKMSDSLFLHGGNFTLINIFFMPNFS